MGDKVFSLISGSEAGPAMIKVASHSETLPLTEATDDVITLSAHRIHQVDCLLPSDGFYRNSPLSDVPDRILSFSRQSDFCV